MSAEGFVRRRDGSYEALVRIGDEARLWPLLRAASRDYAGFDVEPLPGGRGGTVRIVVDGVPYVVRAGLRGGFVARLVRSLYFGRRPRVFTEVETTAALRERGAPIVEAPGAAVSWVAPLLYRSWLVTRWIPDASTLWEWLAGGHTSNDRAILLRAAGAAVRALHRAGARHPDLNLNNILVQATDGTPSVWLLDLDGVRLVDTVVDGGADLARLRRSARKLDPQGLRVRDADLELLERGYQEA